MRQRVRAGRRAGALACVWAAALAGCARSHPLPQAAPAALPATALWHAPLRLRCFGDKQRLRTDALLWLQRPDHFRLHVLGPQGGLLLALACDGQTVSLWDASVGLYQTGPATAATLDALMPVASLHLEAADWLRLWLGELAPAGAQLQRDSDGQLLQVVVPAQQQRSGWSLRLGPRDPQGLPQRLQLAVNAGQQTCDISMASGSLITTPPPNLFVLPPPAAARQQQLGADGRPRSPSGG